jgi:hypothetical protein
MTTDNPIFPCNQCGACCRAANPFTGRGRCPELGEDNLCKIYETRPDICRVEKVWMKYGLSWEEYEKMALEACALLDTMF